MAAFSTLLGYITLFVYFFHLIAARPHYDGHLQDGARVEVPHEVSHSQDEALTGSLNPRFASAEIDEYTSTPGVHARAQAAKREATGPIIRQLSGGTLKMIPTRSSGIQKRFRWFHHDDDDDDSDDDDSDDDDSDDDDGDDDDSDISSNDEDKHHHLLKTITSIIGIDGIIGTIGGMFEHHKHKHSKELEDQDPLQ